jgi:hypothetical protein
MCENGFGTPSLLIDLSVEDMMMQFSTNKGSALKILRSVQTIGSPSAHISTKSIQAPAMASSGLFRWEWRANDGIYIEYDEVTNQQIEKAYQCKLRNVEITISTTGLCYSLDLTARRQYPVDNAQDGGEEVPGRPIRRWDWDSIRNPPPSWDHQVAKFGSFEVEFGTTDYELVSRTLLTRCDGGLHFTPQIVRIQRPQNEPLLGRYNLEKKIMTDKRGAAVAGVVPPLPSLVFFADLSAVSMHFQRRASGTFFSARKGLRR